MPRETSWKALKEIEGILDNEAFSIRVCYGTISRLIERIDGSVSDPDRKALYTIMELAKDLESKMDTYRDSVTERLNDR